jgi:hypothetical protein
MTGFRVAFRKTAEELRVDRIVQGLLQNDVTAQRTQVTAVLSCDARRVTPLEWNLAST